MGAGPDACGKRPVYGVPVVYPCPYKAKSGDLPLFFVPYFRSGYQKLTCPRSDVLYLRSSGIRAGEPFNFKMK